MRLRQEALAAAAIFDDHPTLNWMKLHLIVLTLLFASLCAADPEPAQIQAPVAGDAYQQFIAQMVTPENLTDCILRMDGIVDDTERFTSPKGAVPHRVETETKVGLHLTLSLISSKQAIVYYLVVSRNGQELSFSDATKMAALFCDRAGLPHPIIITEGEKPVFYAEWLIKPSDWKSMHKMMVKVRTENRSEKDPIKAFITAVNREISAREAAQSSNP